MQFRNTYEDAQRAFAYDELGLGGTYHLAFRDLPALLNEHVAGKNAIDFGCGTGRSTRFLAGLGFRCIGLDISPAMVGIARAHDPRGDYRVIADGDFSSLPAGAADLILSAFTFDNVPGRERRVGLFAGLRDLLGPQGRLVIIVSSPELYTHEWVTFTTRAFPENAVARAGDVVRVVTREYSDGRPVEDVLWTDEAYQATFRSAGLAVERIERPLATGDEATPWVSETRIAPWTVYVLRSSSRPASQLVIRRATVSDAEAIADVFVRSFAEYDAQYSRAAFQATTPSAQAVRTRFSEGPCWVGQLDAEIVATAAAVVTPAGCLIRGLAVVPEARRAGVAWRLLEAIERHAIDRRLSRLYLSTTPFLEQAIRLYERFGFRRTDEGPTDLHGTPIFTMDRSLAARAR